MLTLMGMGIDISHLVLAPFVTPIMSYDDGSDGAEGCDVLGASRGGFRSAQHPCPLSSSVGEADGDVREILGELACRRNCVSELDLAQCLFQVYVRNGWLFAPRGPSTVTILDRM